MKPQSSQIIDAIMQSIKTPQQAIDMLRLSDTPSNRQKRSAGRRWLRQNGFFKDGILNVGSL